MAKDLIIRSSTEEFITFKLQEKDNGIRCHNCKKLFI